LHAAARSHRSVVTRITAVAVLTGVAGFATARLAFGAGTLELVVVSAALVVAVRPGASRLGARALWRASPLPHPELAAVATSASTTVIPGKRRMTNLAFREVILHPAHQLGRDLVEGSENRR
jgi:hypothetical protein